MLLQWGATACPAAVGKHGMRSFVLLQAHFCGVGNAVMCELPGEERAQGWKNTAAPARELAEKKHPCSFTGQVHWPALVPIRKKALCKCHSPLGWCQPILSPRPQHIWAHLLPWALQGCGATTARVQCHLWWHCWHLAPSVILAFPMGT